MYRADFYILLHTLISIGLAALMFGLASVLMLPAVCVVLDWLDERKRKKDAGGLERPP